jgi:hypothetical protein
MSGLDLFLMIMGILIGIQIGMFVVCLIGFVAEIYTFWQMGRDIAQMVTEKQHKRRAELLAKMIELEQAMQPVPSGRPVIESRGGTVNDPAAVTLAALNAAYPNTPLLPSKPAQEEEEE